MPANTAANNILFRDGNGNALKLASTYDGPSNTHSLSLTTSPSAGATNAPITLLSNASANGSNSAAVPGGRYIWSTSGTFGGTAATLQSRLPDGATFLDILAITANSAIVIDVAANDILRVNLVGGTPSAMYSNIAKVL